MCPVTLQAEEHLKLDGELTVAAELVSVFRHSTSISTVSIPTPPASMTAGNREVRGIFASRSLLDGAENEPGCDLALRPLAVSPKSACPTPVQSGVLPAAEWARLAGGAGSSALPRDEASRPSPVLLRPRATCSKHSNGRTKIRYPYQRLEVRTGGRSGRTLSLGSPERATMPGEPGRVGRAALSKPTVGNHCLSGIKPGGRTCSQRRGLVCLNRPVERAAELPCLAPRNLVEVRPVEWRRWASTDIDSTVSL